MYSLDNEGPSLSFGPLFSLFQPPVYFCFLFIFVNHPYCAFAVHPGCSQTCVGPQSLPCTARPRLLTCPNSNNFRPHAAISGRLALSPSRPRTACSILYLYLQSTHRYTSLLSIYIPYSRQHGTRLNFAQSDARMSYFAVPPEPPYGTPEALVSSLVWACNHTSTVMLVAGWPSDRSSLSYYYDREAFVEYITVAKIRNSSALYFPFRFLSI